MERFDGQFSEYNVRSGLIHLNDAGSRSSGLVLSSRVVIRLEMHLPLLSGDEAQPRPLFNFGHQAVE